MKKEETFFGTNLGFMLEDGFSQWVKKEQMNARVISLNTSLPEVTSPRDAPGTVQSWQDFKDQVLVP